MNPARERPGNPEERAGWGLLRTPRTISRAVASSQEQRTHS